MLFFKKYIDNIENMLHSNNLTKEKSKALKTAKTWGLKAFNSKVDRLNDSALKTFWNSLKNSYINIQDKFAIDIYQKKLSSSLNDCYEKNRDYYKLVELLMHYNCRNCTKKCSTCEIYAEFEEHCIPEPGTDLGNCRYAYRGEDD